MKENQHFSLDSDLTCEVILSIASREQWVQLPASILERVAASHDRMSRAIESGESIYGITTGFGPLVDRGIDSTDMVELQHLLLQQLGCNVGPALPSDIVRATMAIRARALANGVSGVRPRVLSSLVDLINSGATPVIRRYGSVGASGDLVPLATLARCMNGMDSIRMPDGSVIGNSTEVLDSLGVELFSPQPKESLALVNGTSFSTGIAAVCAGRLLPRFYDTVLPIIATCMFLLDESFQHLDPGIARYKPHATFEIVNESLARLLAIDDPGDSPGLPQPAYSTRSAGVWYGAILESLRHATGLIEIEMNGADDNPLIVDDRILHGANFMGSYVAIASDEASAAIARLATGLERLLNRLFHPALNGVLPAFLADEPVGLNSGLQGLQLLCTSIAADIRSRAVLHSHSSLPTNGDNQDIVSMSANAALNLLDLSDRFAHLCAAVECGCARALQLTNTALPPPLSRHWNERGELLEADYTNGPLVEYIDARHLAVWDGQPVT